MDPLYVALTNLGATGIMAAVFWKCWQSADKERKDSQKETTDLGRRSIEADFTVAKSMDGLTSALNSLTSAITSDLQRRQ